MAALKDAQTTSGRATGVPKADLSGAAAKLAAAFPCSRLHPAVMEWAAASSRRRGWAVAFSGGADSLALLLLIWAHWPERRGTLRALHFDHRLRGAESTADATFCRKVCRELGIALVVGRWKGIRRKEVSEAEARRARLEFFRRHGRVIWFGHQQDDIAESMLMRLARGSGAGGLAAPRPVQGFAEGWVHLRPLLTLKKAEIVAALRTLGLEWREDATNATDVFFRNRIRGTVMPAWNAAAGRDAVAGAARSRTLLEEDDAALDAWVDELKPIDARRGLLIETVAGRPRAVIRRALHRWLAAQRTRLDVSSQAFENLLGAVEAGRPVRHSLGSECFGVIRGGVLRLVSRRGLTRRFQRRAN